MAIERKQLETTKFLDIEKVFNSLDLVDMNTYVSTLLGVTVCFEKELIKYHYEDRGTIHISCPDNLVQYAGILSYGLEGLYIKDFGVTVFKEVEYDSEIREKLIKEGKCDEIRDIMKIVGYEIYVTLDYRYELKTGGSNGINLLHANFNVNTKEWSFR